MDWHHLQCLVCGGKACRHEDYTKMVVGKPAIDGLHSTLITDKLIASQRPSTNLIQQYNIIQQFHEKDVVAIFNLQEKGEHPSCGDGIHEESGYSYIPEHFMNADIQYYTYFWRDLTTPSNTKFVMNIMHVMQYEVSKRSTSKVLVHCHAGLGRTGLVLACFMLYSRVYDSPDRVMEHIRARRPGSIQTKHQVNFVYFFNEQLLKIRRIYVDQESQFNWLTMSEFMENQRQLLHGEEYRKCHNTPKIIYKICDRMCSAVAASTDHCTTLNFLVVQMRDYYGSGTSTRFASSTSNTPSTPTNLNQLTMKSNTATAVSFPMIIARRNSLPEEPTFEKMNELSASKKLHHSLSKPNLTGSNSLPLLDGPTYQEPLAPSTPSKSRSGPPSPTTPGRLPQLNTSSKKSSPLSRNPPQISLEDIVEEPSIVITTETTVTTIEVRSPQSPNNDNLLNSPSNVNMPQSPSILKINSSPRSCRSRSLKLTPRNANLFRSTPVSSPTAYGQRTLSANTPSTPSQNTFNFYQQPTPQSSSISEELLKKMNRTKMKLNKGNWSYLESNRCSDPILLVSLWIDFIRQFDEPIIPYSFIENVIETFEKEDYETLKGTISIQTIASRYLKDVVVIQTFNCICDWLTCMYITCATGNSVNIDFNKIHSIQFESKHFISFDTQMNGDSNSSDNSRPASATSNQSVDDLMIRSSSSSSLIPEKERSKSLHSSRVSSASSTPRSSAKKKKRRKTQINPMDHLEELDLICDIGSIVLLAHITSKSVRPSHLSKSVSHLHTVLHDVCEYCILYHEKFYHF